MPLRIVRVPAGPPQELQSSNLSVSENKETSKVGLVLSLHQPASQRCFLHIPRGRKVPRVTPMGVSVLICTESNENRTACHRSRRPSSTI